MIPITGNMHTCKVCKGRLHGSLCARPFHENEDEDPYKGHTCLDCASKEASRTSTSGVAASALVELSSSYNGEPSLKKVKRSISPLPMLLQNFSMADKAKIGFGLEFDPKDKSKPDDEKVPKLVAQKITFDPPEGGGEPEVFWLTDPPEGCTKKPLSLDHLRQVAKQMNIPRNGRLSKFECRHAMSIKVHSDQRIQNTGILQTANSELLETNTACRIVNATFLEENRSRFMKTNDIKRRQDFETGNGRNDENLWVDVSDAVNDHERNEEIGELKIPNDESNNYILIATEEEGVNPNDFYQTTWKICCKTINKLVKVQQKIKELMTESGQNAHDAMQYVENAIKKAKVTGVRKTEAYYFYMRAAEDPDFGTTFQTFLSSTLQMNSTDEMSGDGSIDASSGDKTSKNKVLKSLVGEIRNLKTTMETTRQDDAAYRGKLEKRQKQQAAHMKERSERERINSLAAIADNPILNPEIRRKAKQQVNAYWAKEVEKAASAMQQNADDSE